jgi:hypothetical protein
MKATKKKSVDKRALIQVLRAKGFTTRKATQALNAIINAWTDALWCGEDVEVPGGILQAKTTKGQEQTTLQAFQNISTKEPMLRTVQYPGRRRVVKLKPDPKLRLPVDPPPPRLLPPPPAPAKPATAEEIEERQLVTDLLRISRPADDRTMAIVRQAVGAHPRIPGQSRPYKPGALLRRLREFTARGWRFHSPQELAQQISEHYWL